MAAAVDAPQGRPRNAIKIIPKLFLHGTPRPRASYTTAFARRCAIGKRGTIHPFHPTYTRKGADGQTIRRTLKTWGYYFTVRGRRHQETLDANGEPFKTAQAAIDAGHERLRQVRGGMESDPRKTTFERLADLVTSEYRLKSEASQKSLRLSLRRLAETFAGWRAADITRDKLIDYQERRTREGVTVSTVGLELAYLRRAFTLAEDEGLVVKIPRFPSRVIGVRTETVPEEMLARILPHLPEHQRRLVEVEHEMGWRTKAELLTRQWHHVDFGPAGPWRCEECRRLQDSDLCPTCFEPRPGAVIIEQGEAKNDQPRLFPMTVRLREMLVAQRAYVAKLEAELGRVIPWVFPRLDGQRQRTILDAWKRACRAAGITNRRPHDLRRTAITRRDGEGYSLSQGMALSGHKSASTYLRYVRAETRVVRQAAKLTERARATGQAGKVRRFRKG